MSETLTLAQRVARYDWDGAIRDGAGEIADLIGDGWDAICRAQWGYFLALPELAETRREIAGDRLNRRVSDSAESARLRYRDPYGDAWAQRAATSRYAAQRAGIPLRAQLAGLSFGLAETLKRIEATVAGDSARFFRLADICQRLTQVETELLTVALAEYEAAERLRARKARAQAFRATITDTLAETVAVGARMRGQARGAAGGVSKVLTQTGEVALSAEQSAVAMREAAQIATGLIRAIEDVRGRVGDGAAIMDQAVAQAEQAVATSEMLSDHARSIESILGLIRDIAGQTNLLALNATIEAARAGDAGRGFAVVAQEVKSLANQTARATDDIAHQIAAIQSATRATVDANAEIRRTTTEVRGASALIGEAMAAQAATVSAITAAVDETALAADSMSHAIASIRQETDAVAREVGALAADSEDVDGRLGRLRTAADDFSDKAIA